METSGQCRFCDISVGKYHYSGIDEPFAVSQEFIAIASIGALIEGWSLIIPNTHHLSLRNVYDNPKLADFIESVLPPLVFCPSDQIMAQRI